MKKIKLFICVLLVTILSSLFSGCATIMPIEMLTKADGTVQTVESQYVLMYLMIDVPASTMNQLMGLFNLSQYF